MARAGATLTRILEGSTRNKPVNDLDRAYRALAGKLILYNLLWRYYDGDQPLMYASKRMADIFQDLELASFNENWCAVVIDSATDRILLKSLTVKNTKAQKQLDEIWDDYNLAIEANDVHEAATVIGESFIMIWSETRENEEDELEIFYNDPRLCHLFYEPSNPRKKRFGAKWWMDLDGHVRITLYYPERLEYYRTRKSSGQVKSWKAFETFNPTETEGGERPENPYKEIPFFHYRLQRRTIKSDLTNAIPMQNGVNKLVTDMMVAAEFGAFKQRWAICNADTEALKNAPNEIWELPAGDGIGQQTKVGQFEATDLDNYIKAIDSLAGAIAIISRTPKHYFFGQGGDPSGEALIAMEAPLNKRCSEHIAQFTPVWKDVARFILKLQGITVEQKDIVVTFEKPETVMPKTQAEIRQLGKSSGIPLVTLLRDEGKDEAWIEQMEADKKAEEAASPVRSLLGDLRRDRKKTPVAEEDGEE